MRRWLDGAHPDWPAAGIDATVANMEVLADGTVRPWLARRSHMVILRHLWEHHPSQRWPTLDLPVLVVAAADPTAPDGRFDAAKRTEVDRAVRELPHGRATWVTGDHDLHAQHPNHIAALIHEVATSAGLSEDQL